MSIGDSRARATTATATPAALRVPLRRACACGAHTPLGGRCDACKKQHVQAKFAIGRADDAFEHEADAIADRVMRHARPGRAAAAPVRVQRAADGAAGAEAPASVDAVLARPGMPLAPAVRGDMEARFGRDFSQVRTHTDAAAAQSAAAIGAMAYTAGSHVVFGAGRYAPSTAPGRHLLAHELAHVLQQSADAAPVVRRKGVTLGGFFGNLFRISRYPPDTLQAYLRVLDETGDIEDDHDSDDKARQIVEDWKKGTSDFVLTQQRKALLIREMQSGATGNDDELAILELLERSYNYELAYVFGAGGVTVAALDGDFHGDEQDMLTDFFDRRFEGGYAAAAAGKFVPRGLPAEPGLKMQAYANLLDQDIPGGSRTWNLACVLGILCSQDAAVVATVRSATVKIADFVVEHYWEFDGAAWKPLQRQRRAAHKQGGDEIVLKRSVTCAEIAQTLFHEAHHHGQPDSMVPYDREVDAYTRSEQWTIDRGLPGRSDLRQWPANAKQPSPDPAAIDAQVKGRYSGRVAAAPGDVIVGHVGNDATIERPDGTTYQRPAQKGESHQDVAKTGAGFANLPTIKPAEWVCPSLPKKSGGKS